MAAISPAAQDRLLLLGLGVTACATIELIRRMLVSYREAAVIPPTESKPQYITQDVEDSLQDSTLNKLLDIPNHGIYETTAIIICERALHDEMTINSLLYYITRPDHKVRELGIRAMSMITNSMTVGIINKPIVYAALVKSLEYSTTDYEHLEYDPDWDNWELRDVAERGCLVILGMMIDAFGVERVIKARFIERWLAKEPWGGRSEDERQVQFMCSLTRSARLNQICLPLFRDPIGRERLVDAKLLPSNQTAYDDSQPPASDMSMVDEYGRAGEDFQNMFVESRPRRSQGGEDEGLRRRHREAMVLNDGTRPLARGDIIEREP